jgi:hypothetical protein
MHGMKRKTIKTVLRNKTNAWLNSIEDEELRKICAKETIVTGGSIASMLLGEPINDIDIYFRSKETVRRVADYYLARFLEAREKNGGIETPMRVEELKDSDGKDRVRIVVQSAGVAGEDQSLDYQYFEFGNDHDAGDYVSEAYGEEDAAMLLESLSELSDQVSETEDRPKYEPVFVSSNAISLRGKIQLILRFYGDPDEIHSYYDFVHCMNYWVSGTNNLVLRPESLEALLSRTLVYSGSKYPICSMIRSRKFIERGFRINAGQYLKMAMQIADLDLYDYGVLEEQLTGVDVAYFTEVVSKLRDHNPEKVDSAYLIEIIDRMF